MEGISQPRQPGIIRVNIVCLPSRGSSWCQVCHYWQSSVSVHFTNRDIHFQTQGSTFSETRNPVDFDFPLVIYLFIYLFICLKKIKINKNRFNLEKISL